MICNKNHNLEVMLIRHGESEINSLMDRTPPDEKILAGATFWAELTEKGISQARLLGTHLKESDFHFDYIATSPHVRTQQTLRYAMEQIVGSDGIYHALSRITIASDLREHFQGDWEGKNKKEIGYAKHVELTRTNPEKFYTSNFPGGESPKQVGARGRRFIEDHILSKNYSRVALFCHVGLITWLTYSFFETPLIEIFAACPKSASINSINFVFGKACCYELNKYYPIVEGI